MKLEGIKIIDKDDNKFDIFVEFNIEVIDKMELSFRNIQIVIVGEDGVEIDRYSEKEYKLLKEKYIGYEKEESE